MELKIDKIKGVIFDLDGTLVDTAEVHKQAWLSAMRDLNIRKDIDINMLIGRRTIEIARIIAGNDIAPELAELKTHYYLKLVKELSKELPCAASLISLLKSHGLKISIVTSSNRASALATLKVINYIPDILISGDDVDIGKPSPEPILKALVMMNLNSEEVLGIGDTIIDIKAYSAAKLRYVVLAKGRIKVNDREVREIRDDVIIVNSLCELQSVLAN